MACLSELREQRDALQESVNTGVLSVSVGGQTTTFATIAERQRVLNRVNNAIAALESANQTRPVASTVKLGGF